jgi:uncharacterized membrane protein YgcG
MSVLAIIGLVILGIFLLYLIIRFGLFFIFEILGAILGGGSSGSSSGSGLGGGGSGGGGSSDDW